MKKILLLAALFLLRITTHAQIITTFAGSDTAGINDGQPAIDAGLAQPIGVAIDNAGNVYIGDRGNSRIRKVNTAGIITTIAGIGFVGYSGDDSAATAAKLHDPYGVAVDNAGNIYFADAGNSCIRKISISGIIATIAGTGTHGYNGDNIAATAAQLDGPAGVAVDAAGNVYLTDGNNNRIRKVNTSGIITTIAGTGTPGYAGDNNPATAAEIKQPYSILLDGIGNLYVGCQAYGVVRKINTTGIITTIAGNGISGFSGDNSPATDAQLNQIEGLALDVAGNLYISDAGNYRIRKVSVSGIITTCAGNGIGDYNGDNILATAAQLNPVGLALDGAGNLYVADFGNDRIRRIASTVSVNELYATADQLVVYPNPSSGDFTINLLSALNDQTHVTVASVTGEKIKEFSINTNRAFNVKLDERSGLYFISVITSRGSYNTRLEIL